MSQFPRIAAPIMAAMLLSACDPLAYAPIDLGSGYSLNNGDDDHVYIAKHSGGVDRIIIEQQVVDWTTLNGRWVFILRMVANSVECYDDKNSATLITHYSSQREYWVIDLANSTELGPLTERGFESESRRLTFGAAHLEVPSYYHDNTSAFDERVKECSRVVPI